MSLFTSLVRSYSCERDRTTKIECNLVLVGSVDIYFVNVRSKVFTSRKYINKNYVIVINVL